VSKCWPGVGCEAATGESHFSYLLFLDTCEDEHAHSRYCSTEFVRKCPFLGQEDREYGVGNREELLIEDRNKADTISRKLPRIIKESYENSNNIAKPVKRLTLGLKSNTQDWKRSEDQIQDGDLKIVREDINPNIIVNYLNKKQNRKDNTGKVEPKKQLLLEDIQINTSDLVLDHTKDDVTTEKLNMSVHDAWNNIENMNLEETTLSFEKTKLTTWVDESITTPEYIVIKETVTEHSTVNSWTLMESEEQPEQDDREKIVEGKITTDGNFWVVGFNTVKEQTTNTPITIEWENTKQIIYDEQYTTGNIIKEISTTRYLNKSVEGKLKDDGFENILDKKKVENTIQTNHMKEIKESGSNHELNRIETVKDFQFPEEIIGTTGKIDVKNITSENEENAVITELNDFELNDHIENSTKVEDTTELNINYILDVLKDIRLPGEELSNDVKDINGQYNVRKMIEDGIGKDEDDSIDFGEESERNENLQEDVEYEDIECTNKERDLVEKGSSTNENNEEENTTVDMYAGDVDILFGL
jgi:hypothetical protein